MSCNDPRKVFYIGINKETGKKKIFYTNRYVDYIWRRSPHDKWHTVRMPESQTETHGLKNYETYRDKVDQVPSYGAQIVRDFDMVPCGQCIGCRLDYARQWSARIMLETKKYDPHHCWFVTFTYDDDHLPPARLYKEKLNIKGQQKEYWFCQRYIIDEDTGEFKKAPFASVSKREHQLLMKRIRKAYGNDIRFFMSAEYGSRSYRCHYHYIIFGLPRPSDLKVYKTNWQGDIYYTSDEFIRNCWTDKDGKPKGYVIFGEVTDQSAAYVARYTIKKRKMVDKESYENLGLNPEFCLMSRKPGIGSDYFDDHMFEIYQNDSVTIPSKNGAITIKPPKYFDSLLERYDDYQYAVIKEQRKQVSDDHNKTLAHQKPNLDLDDLFESSERRSENKIIIKKGGDI